MCVLSITDIPHEQCNLVLHLWTINFENDYGFLRPFNTVLVRSTHRQKINHAMKTAEQTLLCSHNWTQAVYRVWECYQVYHCSGQLSHLFPIPWTHFSLAQTGFLEKTHHLHKCQYLFYWSNISNVLTSGTMSAKMKTISPRVSVQGYIIYSMWFQTQGLCIQVQTHI